MEALIVGAAGMVGRKLAGWLAQHPRIGSARLDRLTLADIAVGEAPVAAKPVTGTMVGDVSDAAVADRLLATRPASIFHVAATVMGQAESDVGAGYRINFDTTRSLLEAIRKIGSGYRPRFVYASSTAVYGPPYPQTIPDDFVFAPQSSYGTQKAMCELMLSDHARCGLVDAVSIRLPTICIRPGAPTYGSSGFFSNIVREPLAGREATLPVPATVRHWFASPRAAVAYLVHAAAIESSALGAQRALTMPGLSATVAEEIEALRRVVGKDVVRRIRHEPDEEMTRIAAGLPERFSAERAAALGFRADGLGLGPEETFEDIIRIHIEDDLGGEWVR